MSYPNDGYWGPDGNGGFRWIKYGSGALTAVIVIVVLAIIMNNVDMGGSSNANVSSNESFLSRSEGVNESFVSRNEDTNASTNKKLTDLHIFGTHTPVLKNIKSGSVKDSYGKSYEGPYLDLCSYGNYGGKEYDTQAYTEFVAGGNYSYLSGTFFARAEQADDYTIEFLIFADDVLVYSSGEITRKTKAKDFTIDISNCDIIRVQSRSKNYTDSRTNPGIILVDATVYN